MYVFLMSQLSTYDYEAKKNDIDPIVLEGICRYESDNGRILFYRNKNGSFDVGFCMNNRRMGEPETIPTKKQSIKEAAKELKYWKRQHERFCVKMLIETGKCGFTSSSGRWHGIKNCKRPHPWWAHYNWGFRTSNNGYDRRVMCFMKNGFKKCKKN